MNWLKKLLDGLVAWWNNQKWVLKKWLPTMIDTVLQPFIEKEIEQGKQSIINSLNTYSAKENAVKACNWLKEKLDFLLPK